MNKPNETRIASVPRPGPAACSETNSFANVLRRYLMSSRLFGVSAASRVFLMKAVFARKRGATTRIRLREFHSDFWMRLRGTDLDVVFQMFLMQDYDLSWCIPYKIHIDQICDRIVREGNVPLIIDAGANIGASTLWFALNFPGCHVFGIEPECNNFSLLEKNSNRHKNITVFNAALWNAPDRLSLVSKDTTGWSCRVGRGLDSNGSVPTVTIPELLARDGKLRPVIVKIDIEGAEVSLFRDNTEWLNDIPLVIFEQHDNLWHWLGTWQGTGHAFFSVLSGQKREYLSRGENIFAFLHPDLPGKGHSAKGMALNASGANERAGGKNGGEDDGGVEVHDQPSVAAGLV